LTSLANPSNTYGTKDLASMIDPVGSE